MLTKVKTMSKKTLSMFLAFAMCFTAFVLCNPIEADAIGLNDYHPDRYYYYPEGTQFISSIQFGVDVSSSDAYNAAAANGHTVLQDSHHEGNYNMNTKPNTNTKSYPYIYLGYKTTTNINEALGSMLRAGIDIGGDMSTNFSIKTYTGQNVSVPFEMVSTTDLNVDCGGAYIYLYYHNPNKHGNESIPSLGLPIVSLKGWTNTNSEGAGYQVNDATPVFKNNSTDVADFDQDVEKAGYVYLFYDNTSVFTNITSAVNTLIDALDRTKHITDSSLYTAESWAEFKTARDKVEEIWGRYNNKYKAGDVSESTIEYYVEKLNNAVSKLKTTIKIDAATNGGTTDATVYEVVCGLNTTVDFPSSVYNASKDGYSFLGWNTDKDAKSGSRQTITVPLNSTVYAIFSKNSYTVYFANPITLQTIDQQNVEYGGSATAPYVKEFTPNDEVTHYVFKGWDKDFSVVNSNLNVNAVFETAAHNFVRTRLVAATCISKGTEVYKCSDCGYEKTITLQIDKNNHNNTTDYPEKAPTCQEYGYSAYTYCNDCKTVVKGRDRLPLSDCSWTDWVITEPKCTVDGSKTRKCGICGKTETEKIPSTGHEWGEWTVVKAATCEAAGREQRVCSKCSNAEAVIINALTHNYVDTVVPPTCTERGYTLHKCDRPGCSSSYTDTYVDAAGHDWEDVGEPTKAPTCTATGAQYQECSLCDATRTATVPALGHDWKNQNIIVEATCDSDGLMGATCDRCSEQQSEIIIPAFGHDWDDGTVTKDATCTQDGIRVYKCKREKCGKTMETVIKAKGHTWNDGVVNKEPTCAQEGELLVTCKECREKQINIIPKLPHKYSGTVTAPTCTEQGYTEYFCSDCEDTLIADFVPASGHRYQTTVFAPTCLKEGYTFVHCSVCDHSQKKDFVDARGHDYVTSTIAPTCTDKGYDVHTCSRGDSVYQDNFVDASGHDCVMTTIAPTCTVKGFDLYACTHCKYSYKENYVDALGHNYVEIAEVPPTNTQNGYILYQCEACGGQNKEIIYIGDRALVCITLLDTRGNPVTEAVITITNMNTGESYVITSDLNGYFTEVLHEGDYELYIDRDGYENTIGHIYVIDGEATIEIPVIEDASCDCYCHQTNLWAKIFRIFMKIRKFFGMEVNCCNNPEI